MVKTAVHPEDQSDRDCPVCSESLEIVEGTNENGTHYCSNCKAHIEVVDGRFIKIRR
jgi:transcription elongation factor Elf1